MVKELQKLIKTYGPQCSLEEVLQNLSSKEKLTLKKIKMLKKGDKIKVYHKPSDPLDSPFSENCTVIKVTKKSLTLDGHLEEITYREISTSGDIIDPYDGSLWSLWVIKHKEKK